MYCPKCSSTNTRVTSTDPKGAATYRYQRCLDCFNKFITREVHVEKKIRGTEDCPYPNAKLTISDVIAIRKNEENLTSWELACDYGVETRAIEDLIKFKTWKHIK
tara:strand:+ start:294 stop:608 length:315 start_codon:yes stop_codon:yes gene_type:complete